MQAKQRAVSETLLTPERRYHAIFELSVISGCITLFHPLLLISRACLIDHASSLQPSFSASIPMHPQSRFTSPSNMTTRKPYPLYLPGLTRTASLFLFFLV
ncbi:hypothetical protein GQ54DRAFT_15712 [Martensiomyces pterosporus]|nr:hypothetical protein GQ54DRAFT_15712 [Martensiomyces pterosporus]